MNEQPSPLSWTPSEVQKWVESLPWHRPFGRIFRYTDGQVLRHLTLDDVVCMGLPYYVAVSIYGRIRDLVRMPCAVIEGPFRVSSLDDGKPNS
jgi:hypothetical protein